METYYVEASADDGTSGTNANTDGDYLVAMNNQSITPALVSFGWAFINTNGIPVAATITAATLHWYHHSYTLSGRGNTYHRQIILSEPGGGSILDSSATPPAAGWHSVALDSIRFPAINRTGKTEFRFTVNEPASGMSRLWNVRSWDYGDSNEFAAYLEVEFSLGGRRYRVMVT